MTDVRWPSVLACACFALAQTHIACARATAPPSAEEGRLLYATNGCVSCHGPDGHGDGPAAKTLMPPPRDFRDAAAFKNGAAAPDIARTLADGLAKDGGRMPRFNHLTLHERESIADFVMTLRTALPERTGQR